MTVRRHESPQAFKQALEHRLREAAAGEGRELARLRQLLVFDRFLARVSASFGDRVITKGGMVLELRLERARTTKDVDLSLTGDPDGVLSELQEAGRLDLGDWLHYEITDHPRHPEIDAEGLAYQGRRYRASAMLAGKIYGASFGVDVAFAEPITGPVEELPGSRVLEFAGVKPSTIRVYPIESHVAEKIHAYTLPRTRPNSRVKDLPDIALLASVRTLDAHALLSAVDRTFSSRGTHGVPPALPAPPENWTDVYERMARTDMLPWPTLALLIDAVSTFIDPVLAGRAGAWDPGTWTWTLGEGARGPESG